MIEKNENKTEKIILLLWSKEENYDLKAFAILKIGEEEVQKIKEGRWKYIREKLKGKTELIPDDDKFWDEKVNVLEYLDYAKERMVKRLKYAMKEYYKEERAREIVEDYLSKLPVIEL